MLSRLVRDNGFSMQWAARIIEYEDDQKSVVYTPGHEGRVPTGCAAIGSG
jgi:hypothetical protein